MPPFVNNRRHVPVCIARVTQAFNKRNKMRHYLSSVRISAEQTLEQKHRQGWQKWLENRDRRKGCRLEQRLQKQDRF
jgi:hypothetical protein